MGSITITWIAALFGLALAIFLIFKRINPVYALFAGAIIGCLIGGASFAQTVSIIEKGTQSVMGTAIRVLAAGVLAGVMMESGAAETIAHTIADKMDEKLALMALALSTMIITAVGVFIPVAVLIVAPIALTVGRKSNISKLALLVALSGGGKAGNIISPNPNTIAAANDFHLPLSQVMIAGFIPAIFGLLMATFLSGFLRKKSPKVEEDDIKENTEAKVLIPISKALVAPILAIVLLMIEPIGNLFHISLLEKVNIDAMYILPFASLVGALAMGKDIPHFVSDGLNRVAGTVLILIGAGAIAGLISASDLSTQIVHLLAHIGLPGVYLAPISGILMGLATGSTSTAVILATGSFGKAILATGTGALAAAAMVHAGATVIDEVPQGNYFHITAQSMHMTIKERMKVIPYEFCVGLTMTIVATILYGFILK